MSAVKNVTSLQWFMSDLTDYLAPLLKEDSTFVEAFAGVRNHRLQTGQLPRGMRQSLSKLFEEAGVPMVEETKPIEKPVPGRQRYELVRVYSPGDFEFKSHKDTTIKIPELGRHEIKYLATGIFERDDPEKVNNPVYDGNLAYEDQPQTIVNCHLSPNIIELQENKNYSLADLRHMGTEISEQMEYAYLAGISEFTYRRELLLAIPPGSTNGFNIGNEYLDNSQMTFWYLQDTPFFVQRFENAVLQNPITIRSKWKNNPQIAYKMSTELTTPQRDLIRELRGGTYQDIEGETLVSLFWDQDSSRNPANVRNFVLNVRKDRVGFQREPLITIYNPENIPLVMRIGSVVAQSSYEQGTYSQFS